MAKEIIPAPTEPVEQVVKMPSVFELSQQRAQQLQQQATAAQVAAQEQQNKWQQYMSGDKNPVTELLKVQEPVRNVDAEKRQKEVAKWAVIAEGITTIGQAIAAFGGVRQKPIENKALKSSLSELNRLDNIYLGQKANYDQNKILNAIRTQSRGEALQGQLLSQSQRDAIQAQTLADNAQRDVLKIQQEQEQQTHKEAREDAKHSDLKEYRTATLQARRASGGRSRSDGKDDNKGEKTAYYIKTKDGKGTIAIRPSDELEILGWAKQNIKNPLEYDMSDGANSPERRLKIQNLYHKMNESQREAGLNAKYGSLFIIEDGVQKYNTKARSLRIIDNAVQDIYDNKELTLTQKADKISQLLNNHHDREVINEYSRINDL